MNYKEFNEYKKKLLSPLSVNPDGSMNNDNSLRFSLSYIGGDVKKEIIIARSVADAIYRSCVNIIISKLPNYSEVQTDTEGKFNDILSKLINFHSFKINLDEDYKLTITESITNNVYTLTYDSDDYNPITDIIDIKIEDNIVKTWVRYDSNTILCIIAGSPYSITQYKVDFKKLSLENFNMASEYLRMIASYINLYFGFSSINDNDPGKKFKSYSDEYKINFGKDLSYKRAISEKISIDIKNFNAINENSKMMLQRVKSAISMANKSVRTLTKRSRQIKQSINDMYNSLG